MIVREPPFPMREATKLLRIPGMICKIWTDLVCIVRPRDCDGGLCRVLKDPSVPCKLVIGCQQEGKGTADEASIGRDATCGGMPGRDPTQPHSPRVSRT